MSRNAFRGQVIAIAIFVALSGACVPASENPAGEADTVAEQIVEVNLGRSDEFSLEVDPRSIMVGPVRIRVTNQGELLHQFTVAQDVGTPEGLPLVNSRVDTGRIRVLGQTADLGPGESAIVSVDLPPGVYTLFCNVAGHYSAGTPELLTVR